MYSKHLLKYIGVFSNLGLKGASGLQGCALSGKMKLLLDWQFGGVEPRDGYLSSVSREWKQGGRSATACLQRTILRCGFPGFSSFIIMTLLINAEVFGSVSS